MRGFWIGCAALALAGCVQTGYRYLDDQTAVITARGNAFAKPDQVQSGVMAEAAKLALARGFTRFSILGSQDRSMVGAYRMPSTASTQGNVYAQPIGGGAVMGTYSQNTTYTPGATIPMVYPGMDVMVRLFHDDDAPPGAFRAADFIKRK